MVYLQTRRSSSGKCLNVTSERKATTWRRTADCSRTPAPSILSAFPFCVPWSWWLRRRLGRLTTYESVFIPLSLVVMKSVFCGGNTYLEWRYPMKRGRSVSSRPCLEEGVCHNSVQLSSCFTLQPRNMTSRLLFVITQRKQTEKSESVLTLKPSVVKKYAVKIC